MWFHLFTGNHCPLGRRTLFDMMEWLTAGLTDLNHKVTVGDTIAPSAMNVIWENFHDSDERLFSEHRFKFGLIATEVPTGQTFNWLEYDPWLTRRRSFEKIAPRAEFIWSMVKEPVEDYKKWAPAAFLELGFSEKLVDPAFGWNLSQASAGLACRFAGSAQVHFSFIPSAPLPPNTRRCQPAPAPSFRWRERTRTSPNFALRSCTDPGSAKQRRLSSAFVRRCR